MGHACAMKILHFGDLHVWSRRLVWREAAYPKRWLGPLNLALRRAKKFPAAYRRAAIDAVLAADADVVVFTGDFTTFSLEEEFAEAAELFRPLRERYGDRLFALPGNHDRYTRRSVRQGLLEKHLPWVQAGPVSGLALAPGLRLLGVDHAEPLWVRSNGVAREDTQRRLAEVLRDARAAGEKVLLAGHFPYATPPEHPESWEHRLLGEERLAALVAEAEPVAYLHGHKHARWAIRPAATPKTLCLNCGSVAMRHAHADKQAGFLTFDWDADGLRNLRAHVCREPGRPWEAAPLRTDPA
jgi:3',5'-cyclic AMP phosphodiesterase CpdA